MNCLLTTKQKRCNNSIELLLLCPVCFVVHAPALSLGLSRFAIYHYLSFCHAHAFGKVDAFVVQAPERMHGSGDSSTVQCSPLKSQFAAFFLEHFCRIPCKFVETENILRLFLCQYIIFKIYLQFHFDLIPTCFSP